MRPSGATLCHSRGEGAPSGAVVSHAIVELFLKAELKRCHVGARAVYVKRQVEKALESWIQKQAKLQRFRKRKKKLIKVCYLSAQNFA